MATLTKKHFTVAKKLPILEQSKHQHLLGHLLRMDTISTPALLQHVSVAHMATSTRMGPLNTQHLRYQETTLT